MKIISHQHLLFSFLLLGVLDKHHMVGQLFDGHSIVWVLLQALIQKITGLSRHKHIGRNADLILDNLDQFVFVVDLEGTLPDQHLIHHDTNRPNIYLFIVLVPLEDLRAHIERSAAEGGSHFIV